MLKQGKGMTWQENLQNFSFSFNWQSIYLLDYLILQSHVSDWLQCVPVATYAKKGIAFYQLHQENF